MIFRLVRELADDGIDVAVACRVLEVSRSGYYEWRDRPPCERDVDDAWLANQVVDIHTASRGCYDSPRVHAELRLAGVEAPGGRAEAGDDVSLELVQRRQCRALLRRQSGRMLCSK